MNIHQLSISHDERQDRLLLRLNTQDAKEFRFWLTRRMVMRLLPVMDQSIGRLEAAQPGLAVADPAARQLLTELKRDAFLQTADFATPYDGKVQQLPLGSEPLLVTDAQISLQASGGLQIVFQQKTGDNTQSCQMNLQASLVHGLIHLIRQCMAKADWAMMTASPSPSNGDSAGSLATPAVYKH